jgi:hypothetical protein
MSEIDELEALDSIEEMEADRDHVRMWPRAIFDRYVVVDGKKKHLDRTLKILRKPGVYVLYRDDLPYYVGQATMLWQRLHQHSTRPGGRYDLFWNYFSVFVEEDKDMRNRIEAILIAAMPTSNSAKPRLDRDPYPKEVIRMMRDVRRSTANPTSYRVHE